MQGPKFSATALKSQRERAGWTRRELAAKAGVGHSTVRDLEQGKHPPTGDTLSRLAGALGCRIDLLFVDDTEVRA